MTARKQNETDVILPVAGRVNVGDIPVQVRRINLREVVLLTRVLTKGVGPNVTRLQINPKDDSQVMGLLLAVLPDALDEAMEFLVALVEPVKADDGPRLQAAMVNPDLDSAFDLFSTIWSQEKDTFGRLVGKVRALLAAQTQKSPTGS